MMNIARIGFKVCVMQNGYFVVLAERLIELQGNGVVRREGLIVNLNFLRLARWYAVRVQRPGSVVAPNGIRFICRFPNPLIA